MSLESSPPQARRRLALAVGLFLLAVYVLVYRGGFHSIDEVSIFAVTESLVKFGRFNTDQIAWTQWTTSQAEAQGFFGAGGHVYSKKGLALSLAQTPLYGLALYLPGLGMLQTVSLLNALVTAASGALLLMFARRLGFARPTAVATALIFGLATLAFVYAKYLFSEPLAGLLLLVAAYMLYAYRQEGGLRHPLIAGLAAGLAVVTRANNLFLLPIFGLYLLWVQVDAHTPAGPPRDRLIAAVRRSAVDLLRPLLAFGLGLALPGAMIMAYNALRAGDPLQTGYDLSLFTPNVALGFYKLLFSPLRGLVIYSPILLLALPGWLRFRRRAPAEAWLFAGLVGVTVALFSAWSSGEGLSWGSRFLAPVVPFLVLPLAPLLEQIMRVPPPSRLLSLAFLILLPLSLAIQLLGVVINPWVFLARLQADFGGEFFLENTAALYDFRYSQIVGQLQSWSVENSDLVWWQPWGFDGLAFGLSLGLVSLTGWLLWRELRRPAAGGSGLVIALLLTPALLYGLLARYYQTDRQFGPPDDSYTQTLRAIAARPLPPPAVVTVAQAHYHIPMNRFKARLPLIGFAQQTWPPPQTALPLLAQATAGPEAWLVTIGFPPAAPDNAAERWLAFNSFKAAEQWRPGELRQVRFSALAPTTGRTIQRSLGQQIELREIRLRPATPPGLALPVEFVWLPLVEPQISYSLFLQLLAADGALVAQHDGPPNGGYTPTIRWQPGQPVVSRHALPLPPDLPPGDYRLVAGLYDPATGQRLSVETGADFVELGHITIIPEP